MWHRAENPEVQARRNRALADVKTRSAEVLGGSRMRLPDVWVWALALMLGMTAQNVLGEPYEDSPDASASDADYAAGKSAMDRKNWAEAVTHLQMARSRMPDSADLHNYLGFSYRKLQKMELAFQHYKRSLEANPRHLGAHEYIGEAYLMIGDLANAEKHLAALRSICLLPCEELADLDLAITAYRAASRQVAKP